MMKNTNKFGAFVAMFATAVMVVSSAYAFSGKRDYSYDGDGVSTNYLSIGGDDGAVGQWGLLRIKYGTVFDPGDIVAGRGTNSNAGIILEKGNLKLRTLCSWGSYLHLRSYGGSINSSSYQKTNADITSDVLPDDFVVAGDSGNTNSMYNHRGPFNIAVLDNARLHIGWHYDTYPGYGKHIALNGGILTMEVYAGGLTNIFRSFDGGMLEVDDNQSRPAQMYGNSAGAGWFRVYEGGGGMIENSGHGHEVIIPNLLAPVGGVIASIEVPDRVKAIAWPRGIPQVYVTDSTGSNAMAVVDYDYDNDRVTNITVLCGGENYSEGATANFRYKAGDALLDEPIPCTIRYGCKGGSFTFASRKRANNSFRAYSCTNTYSGATIVDMDQDRLYEHGAQDFPGNPWFRELLIYPNTTPPPRFLESTNVTIKSGCFYLNGASTRFKDVFPKCSSFDFYGGHLGRVSATVGRVTIGGECWFRSLDSTGYTSDVTVDGTVEVDFGAVATNGVTVVPAIKFGDFAFASGAKILVKDWTRLPRGKRTLVLDLSGTRFTTQDNATFAQSDEGILSWGTGSEEEEKKLYARRYADGMFLIFK